MKKRTIIISILTFLLVCASMLTFHSCRAKKQNFSFELSKVTRGKLVNTVTATGTLEAIKTVAVGTQVSGVISKIYVDFNSHVKKGQLLAELDKVPLLANLATAQASLDDANAEVTYQTANYDRLKALYDKKLVAQSDYELALYNYSKALATLKTAKSGYDKAKINLDYATIFSPIDGVVLNRAVDEGQTVAASFSTPTLFSIANDLTQMQVEANIDEADIGQIKDGQKVEFTVDAFSEMKFTGLVTEIRLQPVVTSNVVTYTVIVKAPNPNYKLMPGMTASITVLVEEADDALIVPNKAFRFTPSADQLSTYMHSISDSISPQNALPMRDKKTPNIKTPANSLNKNKDTELWIKKGTHVFKVAVEAGISDGINTQVKSGVSEGDEVILSMNDGNEKSPVKAAAATSPFMPKRPSKK